MRWFLLAALVACTSQKPTEKKPVVIVSDAAPTPDADPLAGYPAPLDRPTGCTIAGKWKADQPHELRLAPNDKPFARLGEVERADVTFGTGVYMTAHTKNVAIAGYADAANVGVFAAKPFVLAGFAVAGPDKPMKFVSATADKLAFELPLPDDVKPKTPVTGERACTDLAIDDTNKFDARAAIEIAKQSEANLVANQAIPLARQAGEPAIAELRYETMPAVDVLEVKGNQTRVVVNINALNPASHVIVFGWVPSSAVKKSSNGFGGSWATGGASPVPRGRRAKDSKLVTCAEPVPFVVELGQKRYRIGTIAPNVVLEVLPGTEDFIEIRFERPDVEALDGARWLAKQSALAACRAK